MSYLIRDIKLAPEGQARINWVKGYMPLLNELEKEFERDKPFKGKKISLSIHFKAKTAYLALCVKVELWVAVAG